MTFYGIPGITVQRFDEILHDNIDSATGELKTELMDELKKLIRQGQFGRFAEAEKYEPDALVNSVIDKAKKDASKDALGCCIKKSVYGDWYIGIREDGAIETNISLDKSGWDDIEEVWVGLNSAVGRKKDGSIIQAGSDASLGEFWDAENILTSTYLDTKKWAVRREDFWIYFDGTGRTMVKSAELDEHGNIIVEY